MTEEFNQFKTKFNEEYTKLVASKSSNSFYMSKEEYTDILSSIKEAKLAASLTDLQRQRLQRFVIFPIGGLEKLIVPLKEGKSLKCN